jgi:hypothetical protein
MPAGEMRCPNSTTRPTRGRCARGGRTQAVSRGSPHGMLVISMNLRSLARIGGRTIPTSNGRLPRFAYFPRRTASVHRRRFRNDGGYSAACHDRREILFVTVLSRSGRNSALDHAAPQGWHQSGASGTPSTSLIHSCQATRVAKSFTRVRRKWGPERDGIRAEGDCGVR